MSPWPSVSLGSLISTIRGGTSYGGESRPPAAGEVGILTLAAVGGNRFDRDACKALPAEILPQLGDPVRAGTLLMTRSNTIDLVGSVVFVDADHADRFLPDLIWELSLHADAPLRPAFLADFLSTADGRRLLQSAAMGTSGSMKKLSMARLKRLKVPFVPLALQDAWLKVRNRIDRLQGHGRELLDAKRAFKRALMNDLLTGRRRFRAFGPPADGAAPPHGWTQHKLREVADVRVSTVDKHSRDHHSPVRLCNYMDVWSRELITDSHSYMRSTASPEEITRFGLRAGDVLVTKDSETREDIAAPSFVVDAGPDLVLGYHCALLRPNPGRVDGHFLATQLRHPRFRRHFIRAAQGASRYGLTIESLNTATVWLPSLEEQQHISAIERLGSEELVLLEEQVDRLMTLKRGLMQRLLSGEIDLPEHLTAVDAAAKGNDVDS